MPTRVKLYKTSSEKDNDVFFSEVVETLAQHPLKCFPGKYTYGGEGTEQWFEIMKDPNYYLYESEREIFSTKFKDIFQAIGAPEFNLIDLGAGDGKKVKILLDGAL